MSLTYVDPRDNDPGNAPGPQDEQPGWLDAIKKSVGGLFAGGPEKPRSPAIDMARWAPVLESAGLTADSPEHKLLTAIAGHVNSAPIPQENTLGQKLGGSAFHALGAGLARGAGASVEGALGPTQAMVQDWRGRRDLADSARMDAHKTGGALMIPQAANAVQNAELRKQADAALRRGYEGIYGAAAPTSQPAASGHPAASPGAPAPIPGSGPPSAAPPAPSAAPAAPHGSDMPAPGVTRAEPGRSADEPQYPLDGRGTTQGNSPIKFHLPDSARQADVLVKRALEENAARVRAGTAKPSGSTEEALKQEANTPGSVLQKAIADDRAAWQASPAYKGRTAEAERYAGSRVEASQARMKGYQEEAETVKQSAYDLDLFEGALNEAVKRNGENATGALADWKLSVVKVAKTLGWPGADVGPEEVMKDWGNRVAGQAAKELTNRVTQSEFKIYRDSVPALTNTVAGNRGIIAASRALNDAKTARMAAANEYMAAMEGSGRTPVLDHQADAYINGKSRAAFDKAEAAFRDVIDLAKQQGGGAAPGKEAAAGAPVMSKEDAKVAARALIAKDPTLSAEAAMQQVLKGGATAPTSAPPAATPTAAEGAPPRPADPGMWGDVKRKAWDWSYPGQGASLDNIRKLSQGVRERDRYGR